MRWFLFFSVAVAGVAFYILQPVRPVGAVREDPAPAPTLTATASPIAPTVIPIIESIPTATVTPKPRLAEVVPIGLFLRMGPGVGFASFRILAAGDVVEIARRDGGWAEVLTGAGETGWVNESYLQLIKEMK